MYILSQKGLLGLLMLLLEEFLSFYLPCVYPSFWLPWAKVYPVLWYMMFQENTENSAVGPYSWLTLRMVKGSGLRKCAFFN